MSMDESPAHLIFSLSQPRFSLLAAVLLFGACVSHPPVEVTEPEEPVATVTEPAESASTQVYFYPKNGQSAEQQDRDRYECYLWAVKQTGFDPSDPSLAPHQRVKVAPMPPSGHGVAVGAVTGAVIGAAVARPGDKAGGAVVGAIAGATIGAASDAAREQEARRLQERYDREHAARTAQIERQAEDYRRAMAACLEGRGYSVSE